MCDVASLAPYSSVGDAAVIHALQVHEQRTHIADLTP